MRGSLCFDIDPSHFARQLDLAADRCTDYFRLAFPKHLDPHDAPRVFFRPRCGSPARPTNTAWCSVFMPSARGKGLGAAVHQAFERWASGRGARRLVVAVADNNPRARRFWRDHLGYRENLRPRASRTTGNWNVESSIPKVPPPPGTATGPRLATMKTTGPVDGPSTGRPLPASPNAF